MHDYIKSNKEAWEKAFSESTLDFKERTILKLKDNPRTLFTDDMIELLEKDANKYKVLGHFCCNNGRETLASLSFGYQQTIGFDIAENMVDFANQVAKDLNLNAMFYAKNILEIDESFNNTFDTIIFTVGAITWFKNPIELFSVVNRCLKIGGTLIIEDLHPFSNQLATESEEGFDSKDPKKLVHSYFKTTPWIEQGSMGYMTGKNESIETFYSHSHTLSTLMMAIINQGFMIDLFSENQVCQANLFPHLNHTGVPLTYLLKAKKL